MSGEHAISKAILKHLGKKTVFVEGYRWAEGVEEIGINSLTGNVLCENHNSRFSDLDTTAGRLFGRLQEMPERFKISSLREACAFDGLAIERWMLKTACSLIASGQATRDGEVVLARQNAACREVLMGRANFANGAGLHLEANYTPRQLTNEFWLQIEWYEDRFIGITTSFIGFVFRLFVESVKFEEDHFYRPGGIVFRKGDVEKVMGIRYGTPDLRDGVTVLIRDDDRHPESTQ